MGISGGGLVAAFTAALDVRFRAAIISGYASTFQLPDIIGLIVPRPLFIEAGTDDRVRRPRRAVTRLEEIYAQEGALDVLDADFFAGGHEISQGV